MSISLLDIRRWTIGIVNLRKGFGSCAYCCLYAYSEWEKLELVVYVTLRKCSRACEYFSPRYAYVGGQLVLVT